MRAALFSWGCNYALILFPRFILPASLPELALVLGVPRFLAFRSVTVLIPAASPDEEAATVLAAGQHPFRSVRLPAHLLWDWLLRDQMRQRIPGNFKHGIYIG